MMSLNYLKKHSDLSEMCWKQYAKIMEMLKEKITVESEYCEIMHEVLEYSKIATDMHLRNMTIEKERESVKNGICFICGNKLMSIPAEKNKDNNCDKVCCNCNAEYDRVKER